MDAVKPLPVFQPVGLAFRGGGDGDLSSPPKTFVFNVHGLRCPKPTEVPGWVDHWIPPDSASTDSSEATSYFTFDPSTIVQRAASECALERVARDLLKHVEESSKETLYVFVGHEFGGVIVKLALVIAARETRYRRIFDATQTAVFFSTPHRPSSTHSMDSTVLVLLQSTYGNVIEEWLPAAVNNLSRQLDDIHKEFSFISHNFGIISYYQSPQFLGSGEAAVTQECATTGLENEISMPCSLPLRDMSVVMSREEQAILQMHLINTKIARWERFRQFKAVLRSTLPTLRLDWPSCSDRISSEMMMCCSHDKSFSQWKSSRTGPRYLKVIADTEIDSETLLNSVARSIHQVLEPLWIGRPTVVSRSASNDIQDEASICASLVLQVLTQQPRTFLHMAHLATMCADAIRGSLENWKRKALWLCLRTVMHAPIGTVTYGYLPVKTPANVNVLRKISSSVDGTDSTFRLVLDCSRDVPSSLDCLNDLDTLELDFRSEDLKDCLADDSRRSVSEDTVLQLLPIQLRTLGRPVFVALSWIVFAVRPLSLEELNAALVCDHTCTATSLPTKSAHGAAYRLPQLLPDVVAVNMGRVHLRVSHVKMCDILTALSTSFLSSDICPQLYIAQSCLLLLSDRVLDTPKQEVVDQHRVVRSASVLGSESNSDSELDSSSDSDENADPDKDILTRCGSPSNSEHQISPWVVCGIPGCHCILAEYVSLNWIIHYRLAGEGGDGPQDEPYLSFVGEDEKIRSWLDLVERLTETPASVPISVMRTYDGALQERLGISRLEYLELLCRLAGRPRLGDTPDERIFLYAAELGDETILRLMYPKLHTFSNDIVMRALATTSGTIHADLRSNATFLEGSGQREELMKVHLTAQLIGNDETSHTLRSNFLSSDIDFAGKNWFSEALQQAIDCNEHDVLEDLLHHAKQNAWMNDRDSTIRQWTPLHRAAGTGNMVAVTRLCESELIGQTLDQISPDGRSALYIASSFGLINVVHYLIGKGAQVDEPRGPMEQTALHTASDYGHIGCVAALLKGHADVTIADTDGNFSLHLALRRGHASIAELLVANFPSVSDHSTVLDDDIDLTQSPAFKRGTSDETTDDNVFSGDSHGDRPTFNEVTWADYREDWVDLEDAISAPLNRGNELGINALFAAADRDLPKVALKLLGRGADPNILGDHARVPLHMATKAGCKELVLELLKHGSVTNHMMENLNLIPLHYPCYRGRHDIVELLVGGSDLSAEDVWGRTPLVAAGAGGYVEVIKTLLPHLEKPDLVSTFLAAVERNHYDVVSFLLDIGCPVDGMSSRGAAGLHLAAENKHSGRMVRLLLLRGANPKLPMTDGSHPLHLAAQNGSLDAARLLIDAGAPLNDADQYRPSPLISAIYNEHPAIVRLLIERGARMELSGRWSYYDGLIDFSWGLSTPAVTTVLLDFYRQREGNDNISPSQALCEAICRSSKRLTKLVLKKLFTPDLGERCIGAQSAICDTIKARRPDLLRLILGNNIVRASIDQPLEPDRGTPLHCAVRVEEKEEELVDILLEHNADTSVVSGKWGTALNEACGLGKFVVAKKILAKMSIDAISLNTGKYGTSVRSVLAGCSAYDLADTTIEMLEALKKAGASMTSHDGQFSTALHAAARFAPLEVITWVYEQDESLLFVENVTGHTPFHIAIHRGNLEIIQELEKLSGNPLRLWQHRDVQDLSVLHYAAITTEATSMVKLLSESLDNGEINAMLNISDVDGWTPLHWACRKGTLEILEALLKKGADPRVSTSDGWTPRQISILYGCTDEFVGKLPKMSVAGDGIPEFPEVWDDPDGSCDACFIDLRENAYRCASKSCEDFVVCFKCYQHVEMFHTEDHKFEEVCHTSGPS